MLLLLLLLLVVIGSSGVCVCVCVTFPLLLLVEPMKTLVLFASFHFDVVGLIDRDAPLLSLSVSLSLSLSLSLVFPPPQTAISDACMTILMGRIYRTSPGDGKEA